MNSEGSVPSVLGILLLAVGHLDYFYFSILVAHELSHTNSSSSGLVLI